MGWCRRPAKQARAPGMVPEACEAGPGVGPEKGDPTGRFGPVGWEAILGQKRPFRSERLEKMAFLACRWEVKEVSVRKAL